MLSVPPTAKVMETGPYILIVVYELVIYVFVMKDSAKNK